MKYGLNLLIIEGLTLMALKEFPKEQIWWDLSIVFGIHVILSIWLWSLLIEAATYKSFFDNPDHIALRRIRRVLFVPL